jgi:hypothetical protein
LRYQPESRLTHWFHERVGTTRGPRKKGAAKNTVMIGGHFPRAVRRSLAQLQADPRNDGKKLNDLLALQYSTTLTGQRL